MVIADGTRRSVIGEIKVNKDGTTTLVPGNSYLVSGETSLPIIITAEDDEGLEDFQTSNYAGEFRLT